MHLTNISLKDKINKMISDIWNPKTNENYAKDLSNLIDITLANNWKELGEEFSKNIKKRLSIIDEYKKTVTILEYLRNWDKEEVMKKYNWSEHEAKYNKKLVFDKLEEKKKALAILLGDKFEE